MVSTEKINLKLLYFLTVNVLALFYLLSIAYFNIPTNDDWVFLNKIDEVGITGFIDDSYKNWQGRFSYYFIISFFLKIYTYTKSTILITLILITSGVASLYLLIRKCFNNFDFITSLSLAIFVFNLSVMGALDFTSFFWICASAYYMILYATVFFVVLVGSNYNALNLFLLVLLSIIIGGGAESYTSFVILFFALFIILNYFLNKKIYLSNIIILVILFICFFIMVKAPGNQIRMNLFEQSDSILALMRNSVKPFFQLLVYMLPKFFLYVFSSLPFIYLGSKYKGVSLIYVRKLNFRFFLFTIVLLFGLFYVSLLPGIYATSVLTPLRALNHLTLLSIVFFSFWGFVLGLKRPHNNYDMLFYVTITSLFIYVIFLFSIDISRMRVYKSEIDNRISYLNLLDSKFNKDDDSIVIIEKIKVGKYKDLASYTYHFFDRMKDIESKNNFEHFPVLIDEITHDPSDFRNLALKNRLRLKFNVIIRDN